MTTMIEKPRRLWRAVRLGVAIAASLMLLAACGGSSGGAASGGSSGPATVETHSSDLGTYLTDGSGRTLYLFASDTNNKSGCSGTCATYWPPVNTTGAPSATGGATASMLGTITRSDGSTQVTYNGHPLYYYANDGAAGDIKGQGNTKFGARWWIVSPAGAEITATGSTGSPYAAPSTGAGGGWS
ncbi:MAG: COG4315 family predicted lipoprotein [Nocardioidaceae bacterium]